MIKGYLARPCLKKYHIQNSINNKNNSTLTPYCSTTRLSPVPHLLSADHSGRYQWSPRLWASDWNTWVQILALVRLQVASGHCSPLSWESYKFQAKLQGLGGLTGLGPLVPERDLCKSSTPGATRRLQLQTQGPGASSAAAWSLRD